MEIEKELEKEFVPYDLAFRMKELGFDEPCLATFIHGVKGPLFQFPGSQNSVDWEGCRNCSALTWRAAFKWFRKKYNILSRIDRMRPSNRHFFEWRESDNKLQTGEIFFDTYEEAELACLEKLIEIIS
jgi:hypothetical protein